MLLIMLLQIILSIRFNFHCFSGIEELKLIFKIMGTFVSLCRYVHVSAGAYRIQKRGSDSLEPELQADASQLM